MLFEYNIQINYTVYFVLDKELEYNIRHIRVGQCISCFTKKIFGLIDIKARTYAKAECGLLVRMIMNVLLSTHAPLYTSGALRPFSLTKNIRYCEKVSDKCARRS